MIDKKKTNNINSVTNSTTNSILIVLLRRTLMNKNELLNSITSLEQTLSEFKKSLSELKVTEDREPTNGLSFCPDFHAYWSFEDYYMDYTLGIPKHSDYLWFYWDGEKNVLAPELIEQGFVSPEGDLLKSNGSITFFPLLRNIEKYPLTYSGVWVLEFEGAAEISFNYWRQIGNTYDPRLNRTYVTVKCKDKSDIFRVMSGSMKKIKFYREEHKELIDEGLRINPSFIERCKNYDIVRLMNLQQTNGSLITTVDQVPTVLDHFLYNENSTGVGQYGVPFNDYFEIATKADVDLHIQIPAFLGVTEPSLTLDSDFLRLGEKLDTNSFKAEVRRYISDLLETADSFSFNRTLYISYSNEVWNYARGFFPQTQFARGYSKQNNPRIGYAMLFSMMMDVVMEVNQNYGYDIKFPFEIQTASDAYTTEETLKLLDGHSHVVLSPTNYTSLGEFYDILPENDWLVQDYAKFSLLMNRCLLEDLSGYGYMWLKERLQVHLNVAKRFGINDIVCYEGMSHDNPPERLISNENFRKNWYRYHYGPDGANAIRTISQRLWKDFPGITLSNYSGIGEIHHERPWIDGHPEKPTAMLDMLENLRLHRND